MKTSKIETPRGMVVINSGCKAELKFNSSFVPKWTGRYSVGQKFLDNEVLAQSTPFTPMLTSMLIKTGILGTEVGSGTVSWIAPYARFQYYRGRRPGTKKGEPLRGRFWFERMFAVRGQSIIAGTKKRIGTGK